MSVSQSNLSAAGYDMVVGITQNGLNATMKNYFKKTTMPTVTLYYMLSDDGYPTLTAQADVLAKTGGIDPLQVAQWDGTGTEPADVAALREAWFSFAITATIGNPNGYLPAKQLPNYINLNSGTDSICFSVLCSKFQIVQNWTPFTGGAIGYLNVSQPDGDAWIFTANMNLKNAPADISKLPADVQAQVNKLDANSFTIQQLIFDLDTLVAQTTPTISGVTGKEIINVLNTDFLGTYFKAMEADGGTILNYSITEQGTAPSSPTLAITGMEVYANAFVDANGQVVAKPTVVQQNLSALNHLCAVNGGTLKAPAQLNWNWQETTTDMSLSNGVVAISRQKFVEHIWNNGLAAYVTENCIEPTASVGVTNFDNFNYPLWQPYGTSVPQGAPAITESGSRVVDFTYSPQTAYAANSSVNAQMWLSSLFTLTVDFTNVMVGAVSTAAIIVSQHLLMSMKTQTGSANPQTGNLIDRACTNTYTIQTDVTGTLTFNLVSSVTNNGAETISPWNFPMDNQDTMQQAQLEFGSHYNVNLLTELVFSDIHAFVFPGGNTFTFKSPVFSDYQDLVCNITYDDF